VLFWRPEGSFSEAPRGCLRHEQVHQALAPKPYLLRNFRIDNRLRSYFNSSLWRFLEEALAQVYGTRQFFAGVRFPVKTGYVFL
jgi:hypothetical protein